MVDMKSKIPVVSSDVPMPVVKSHVTRLTKELKQVLLDMLPGQSIEIDEHTAMCVKNWAFRRDIRFTCRRQSSGKFIVWKVGPAV